MVAVLEKFGVNKAREKQAKGTVGDLKARSQREEFLKSPMQAKREDVLSDFFSSQ